MRAGASLLTRPLLLAAGVLALAACQPTIPDSAAGVGDDTSPFNPPPRVETGQTINGDPLIPNDSFATETTGANANWQSTQPLRARATPNSAVAGAEAGAGDIADQTAAALAAAGNSGVTPIEASPSNPAPALVGNPGISDENDFAAVSSRQTIESDAERLARLRAQRQEVAPTALPQREGAAAGTNIVQYALTTSNPKGNRIYTRAGINLRARAQRNCAQYPSSDLAQVAFLEAGGPRRDKLVLDPDGDGYACGWDPRPLRAAVRAGN
ncbi:hypothetical protein TRM7557_03190 [Tritonibacter multivorans]|uniref:Excalibur calcium-binding domain-containing protein n=1 Tax=Tritonibacter multivorans TaxID=928856 RepID=A0A0P1GHG8_9RHOB|nr:hypothetical protein [Tritonibacter multivorans]MDA7420748.1 hypothetical protein [Tritonibacter multivorans]CUH81034.1 hypothetical protein TRM7557_03190 [Tritonibacter multivorans]SFC25959.1 hypothetical protein SAMN04488049_10225 [Tritonibacter multivorans]